MRTLGHANYRSGELEFEKLHFVSDLKKMPIKMGDICKMIAEVETPNWRLRECIWVRKLAATHRLELLWHLRMLEEQEA